MWSEEQHDGEPESVAPPGFGATRTPTAATRGTDPAPTISHAGRTGGDPEPWPITYWLLGLSALAAAVLGAILLLHTSTPTEQQVAASINLRSSDAPGWVVISQHHSRTSFVGGANAVAELDSCGGVSTQAFQEAGAAPGQGVSAVSPTFLAGTAGSDEEQLMSSQVLIAPSRAIASEAIAEARVLESSQSAQNCLSALFRDETGATTSGESVQITNAIVSAAHTPPTDARASAGVEVYMDVDYGHSSISTIQTIDFYLFAVGRYEITLLTDGFDSDFPAQAAQKAADTLVSRARAAPR